MYQGNCAHPSGNNAELFALHHLKFQIAVLRSSHQCHLAVQSPHQRVRTTSIQPRPWQSYNVEDLSSIRLDPWPPWQRLDGMILQQSSLSSSAAWTGEYSTFWPKVSQTSHDLLLLVASQGSPTTSTQLERMPKKNNQYRLPDVEYVQPSARCPSQPMVSCETGVLKPCRYPAFVDYWTLW